MQTQRVTDKIIIVWNILSIFFSFGGGEVYVILSIPKQIQLNQIKPESETRRRERRKWAVLSDVFIIHLLIELWQID